MQDYTYKSLNGSWKYRKLVEQRGQTSKFERIHVPTFWNDRFRYCQKEYHKKFKINSHHERVILTFDRLDFPAKIYLNEEMIYSHEGDEIFVEIEITREIIKEDDNILKIKAEHSNKINLIRGDVYLRLGNSDLSFQNKKYSQEQAINIPDWVDNSIIYEIYVRNFSQSGDLSEVRKSLKSFKSLGINCLWLIPVFPIGELNKKGKLGSPYSIRNYKAVNPNLGDENELNKLVKKAHKMEMKVILDIACNHSARDNPLVSQHPEWYKREENGKLKHPKGTNWIDVADLDYSNYNLRKYMLQVLKYWIEEYEIDGYRMDVAEFLPLEFWRNALEKIKEVKPEIMMLAEGDHPKLHSSAFHLSYSWNIRFAVIEILNRGASAEIFGTQILSERKHYPIDYLRMRFTENHDLQRANKVFGVKKSKIAAVLSYLIEGVPMVYNGQEIGANSTPSLFNNDPIVWHNKNRGLEKFYAKLFKIRKDFQLSEFNQEVFLQNTRQEEIISFLRRKEKEGVFIIVNTRSTSKKVQINFPGLKKCTDFKILMGNYKDLEVNQGKFKIKLLEYGFSIFHLEI